ncbi:MAG TPA: transporter [Bacteroidia bacterium]|nr:transporter [Bacteroidia bacterium]
MKKHKLVMACVLLMSLHSFACDICGNYMGITPYDNKNSISFLHRYRVFNGYRDYQSHSQFFPKSAYRVMHADEPIDSTVTKNYSSKDFESYKIFELRFKYFVFNRLELNVFIPLLNNKSKTDDEYTSHTGLGDISFNAGYHLITPKDKRVRHKLILGAGIKLPSGNYYAHDEHSDRLPFEMQSGTGSCDGFAYINYVVMTKKVGASASLNYKANGYNKLHEKLCNSHNDFVSVFYKIPIKNIILYPSVQANYEYTDGLKVKDELQKNTDVNSLLLGPGLDIYYKSFSVNLAWQFTTYENVNEGSLKSAGRLSFGLNYSFGKKDK